jgi:nucleoside-diphosphate-sugar epimerase
LSALQVLFIGGTGTISSACAQLAVQSGIELSVLNRGHTATRPLPESAKVIHADIRDQAATRAALGDRDFDVVVDFVAFTPDQVKSDIELFSDRTGQYVFISSASAYQKPVQHLPILESTPLVNPFWEYSRNKIACEDLLVQAYRDSGFPATIVRPSHTYDRTRTPFSAGWTLVERMRQGKEVVVHGDGTSLWTLTHHDDFAIAFNGLLGNTRAIGDSFHITSDEALTWDQIHHIMATAAGTTARLVHMPSEVIAAVAPAWGPGLVGDKAFSVVFDNSKVKSLVPEYVATIPYEQGAREIVDWHDADPARRELDPKVDAILDRLVELHHTASRG